jgi:chondroitin AC lyase
MCFDRYIVCIGSSIVPKSKGAVETTVNSIWLRPKFIFNLQNGTNSKNPPDGNYSVKSISHDNLEYIFPQYASINLDTSKRTGSWRQVVGYMSDTPVKGRLFTLYLKHKAFPANYYYIIRPLARSASPGFIRLEASSPDIHAGIDTQANLFMGSFFVPGKVKIPGMGELTLVTPALVLIQNKKISLCAPDWKRPCIKGFWSGKPFECKSYNGQSVSYTISDSGLKAQSTAYALKQPVSSKY